MCKAVANAGITLTLLLLWLFPAAAQVVVGDNVSLSLAGDVAAGYTGSFSDTAPSANGLNIGGYAQLNGFYYSPKFISFQIQPYYNRSQANSSYQSITDSSGITGTANFFTGSHFPGSVTFSKTYDSTGQFGVPGASGLSTSGSGDSLVINWAANLAHLPSLNVSYNLTGQESTVYGASSNSHSASSNLNLNSTYSLAGFNLQGIYTRQSTDTSFPSLLDSAVTQPSFSGEGHYSSYGIQASHRIPLSGYWTSSFTRSGYETDSRGGVGMGSSEGTSNGISSSVSINPLRKLGFSFGTSYQTNVFAALEQQILATGSLVPLRASETDSHALAINGAAYFTISSHLTANGQWNHREEVIGGQSIAVTQYGGGINFNYARPFLGSFSFSIGARDTATQAGNSGAGLIGNVNFSRRLRGWDLGANFSYSQQIETLLAVYTTSSYSYSTNARRRFGGKLYWSGTFHGSHSGLMKVAGSSNHTEGTNSSVTYGRYSVTGTYAQSGGVSILTAQGLVSVPTGVPTPLVSNQLLYNAKSFGFGGSASLKRWVLTANYSKARSGASGGTEQQQFESRMVNARLQYRVRKMYLNAGFTRFVQGLSTRTAPTEVNNYYFGVSRWFNVF